MPTDLDGFLGLGQRIGRIVPTFDGRRQPLDHDVDFPNFETGDIEAEIQLDLRQRLELLGQ